MYFKIFLTVTDQPKNKAREDKKYENKEESRPLASHAKNKLKAIIR